MSGNYGPGGLDDLFEAAGKRSGEHRAMIVLAVLGLAVAMILAAFFVGRGFAERADEASETVVPSPPGGVTSLAEAALGEELRTEPSPTRGSARPR